MTKRRLIDIDILKNKISEKLDKIKSDRNKIYPCEIYEADVMTKVLETAMAEVEEMSTIDVPESNAGKWTPITYGYEYSKYGFVISSLSKHRGCNYCPKCGYIMKG